MTDAGLVNNTATILAVDDDAAQLALLRIALLKIGNVVGARSAAAAMEAVKEQVPALALVDITVGAESGWEIALALRAAGVPKVIAVSGNPVPAEQDVFDAWIEKPYSIAILGQIVARHLR